MFPHYAKLRVLLLVMLLCAALRCPAAEPVAVDIAQAADDKVTALMESQLIPGLSLAIVDDNALVLAKGYGLADLENDVPATENTVYRLASISKMLTAVAAMQLAEQGKLDLDAPIQKYVPAFPKKQWPVTARNLLKHQSGIRHYRGREMRSVANYRNVADGLAIFQDDELLFEPGDRFSYSTYGYNLLGCAIEGASDMPYAEYIQQYVLQPAGVKTIQPDNPDTIIPHRAAGYRRGPGRKLLNSFMVNVTNKLPGGGWCGSVVDLARFGIAYQSGKLVSAETLERMWTPQQTNAGETTESGLGCFIDQEHSPRRVFHSGGQPKVSTFLLLCPERGCAVAVMCNQESGPVALLAQELMDLID
ncbi:MAG: beta-lactamase family protein [Pirellulales bacterium]|nr:beta-lactamase family protein [Pirellulales bacterium]